VGREEPILKLYSRKPEERGFVAKACPARPFSFLVPAIRAEAAPISPLTPFKSGFSSTSAKSPPTIDFCYQEGVPTYHDLLVGAYAYALHMKTYNSNCIIIVHLDILMGLRGCAVIVT